MLKAHKGQDPSDLQKDVIQLSEVSERNVGDMHGDTRPSYINCYSGVRVCVCPTAPGEVKFPASLLTTQIPI